VDPGRTASGDRTIFMTETASPTGRALLALEAIQQSPGITGERLAGRLGVTDRAARRYVGILREAGIPIESTSGPYGGYRIGRGARIPPLTFTTAEALGLVMAVLQGWHGTVEADHPAASALGKIMRVLPASAAAPAEAMRRVQAQNPSDAAAMPDPALAAAVAQACEAGEQLRIAYRTGTEFVLDPWAVVVRHGRWYLLGRLAAAEARRVLRLDRIVEITPTGATFPPPTDLDAVREVEEHLADGWAYDVEVRIAAPFADVAPCVPRTLGRLEATGDDSCVLRGSTENPWWYAEQLAAVPGEFTVVTPDELRRAVGAVAARLARAVDHPDVRPIGRVESPLTDLAVAPRQPDEGAPSAVLALDPSMADALAGLQVGDRIIVVTWFDRADRDVRQTHPRSDVTRPLTGVFATRSPDRPNPIGLHTVRVTTIDGSRIGVDAMEALDATPILDIKIALG
jgi:tRNA-Thr(GGU) m(6)t(6)A37 methyltransferase TsaA